jgi:peptidyl-prolyl cis-trans isomerase D
MAAVEAGLQPDDVMAAKQVQQMIAPLVEKGMTKQEALQRIEQVYNTSETDLVNAIKGDIAREQLFRFVSSGAWAPQQMVGDALRFRNEYRRGDYFRLTAENAGDVKAPADAELKSYYGTIAGEYALPEYRTLSVLILDKKVLGDSIKISNDRLKQYYDENADEYKTPETRVISQVVAPDETAAKLVYAMAHDSKDLPAAAKANKASYIKPASFTEKEIAAELAKTAFSGKQGDVMPPVKSPLGWHVIYVEKVTPGKARPFEEAKADIEKELSQDKVSEALYQKANKIDDEIGGGKTLAEVAKENNIAETVLTKIDAHGMGADGKKANNSSLPIFDKLVQTGFGLKKGAASQLIETPDGAFAIVGASDIFPSEQQPFDKVRANVLNRWMTDHQLKSLNAKAAQIGDELKKGASFEKLAAEYHQPVQSTGLLQRGTSSSKAGLDGNLITALFALEKPNEATSVAGDNSVIIVRLAERKIQVPQETAKKDNTDMENILQRALKQDLLEQYRESLMAKYDVKINDKLLDSLFQTKNENGDSEE